MVIFVIYPWSPERYYSNGILFVIYFRLVCRTIDIGRIVLLEEQLTAIEVGRYSDHQGRYSIAISRSFFNIRLILLDTYIKQIQ